MLINHRLNLFHIIKVSTITWINLNNPLRIIYSNFASMYVPMILFRSNKNNIFTKLKCNLEDGHPLKIFMSTETSDQYLEILRIIHAIYPTNDVIWFANNDHAEKGIIISRKVLLHERLSPLCMVQFQRFVRHFLNWNAVSITSLILLNQQRICIVCNSI